VKVHCVLRAVCRAPGDAAGEEEVLFEWRTESKTCLYHFKIQSKKKKAEVFVHTGSMFVATTPDTLESRGPKKKDEKNPTSG
jgi:hypothetical protein